MSANEILGWLADSAVFGFVILTIGAIAVRCRKEPVERLRLIEWTLLGCLIAPLVHAVPGVPRWSLGMTTVAIQQPEAVVAKSDDPQTIVARDQPALESKPSSSDANSKPTTVVSDAETPNIVVQEAPIVAPDTHELHPNLVANSDKPAAVAPVAGLSVAKMPGHIDWARTVVGGYLAIVVALFIWSLIGLLRLAKLDRRASTVPEAVAKLFASIAASHGAPAAQVSRKTRLRMSGRIDLPLAYGIFRPTILLPEAMCAAAQDAASLGDVERSPAIAELRYAIGHELSHLERGDVLRWRLTALFGNLFFYQPIYWWLRRQLRLCQDYLADSRAAQQTATNEDYAQFLVTLAQRKLHRPAAMALGVADRRSNLFRRVLMLLGARQPLVQRLRWQRSLAIGAAAVLLIVAASSVKLTAEDAHAIPGDKQIAQAPPARTNVAKGEASKVDDSAKTSPQAAIANADEILCSGEVKDALVGKPIAGAKVTVWRLSSPEVEGPVMKQLEALTDADGKFSVQLPANDPWVTSGRASNFGTPGGSVRVGSAGNPSSGRSATQRLTTATLPYVLRIQHPDYATQRRAGMLTISEAQDAASPKVDLSPKHFGALEVRPGKAVIGTVVSADGAPIQGVKIFAHSMAPKNERDNSGTPPTAFAGVTGRRATPTSIPNNPTLASRDETETDANGKFQVTMISPGEGAIWITPDKDFAPQVKVVYDQRGDLGKVVLEKGAPIRGRVVDLQGKPLASVFLSLYPSQPGQPKYSGRLNEELHRAAETDASGNFVMGPLPRGEYKLDAEEYRDDHPALRIQTTSTRRELPGVFTPLQISIAANGEVPFIEYKASPAVQVKGKITFYERNAATLDTADRYAPSISGTTADGAPFTNRGKIDKDGDFTLNVPRGLQNATLQPFVDVRGNTSPGLAGMRGQMDWRLAPNQQLKTNGGAPTRLDPKINLGTLNNDIPAMEIGFGRTPGSRGRGFGGFPGAIPLDPMPDEVTVIGKIEDAETKQPIAGVKVFVHTRDGLHSLGDFTSDSDGAFQFQLPTKYAQDGVAENKSILLELRAISPHYAGRILTALVVLANGGDYGQGIAVGLTDDKCMLQPVQLKHGDEVSGVVKASDGQPAPRVKVLTSTSPDVQDTWTDADGRFRMRLPDPGNVALLIYPGEQGSPQRIQLADKRGDLGVIQLTDGTRIKGRILDAAGAPLAGTYLLAEGGNADFKHIERAAKTNVKGEFTFAPLPPGRYRVSPKDAASDLSTENLLDRPVTPRPLPGLFVPHTIELSDQPTETITFQIPPTVTIEGQVKVGRSGPPPPPDGESPARNPYRSYAPKIVGMVGADEFTANVSIDSAGEFTATVPHDIADVQIKLADQYNRGPQFRTGKNKPLVDPLAIHLGTVSEDVRDIEIVYPEPNR